MIEHAEFVRSIIRRDEWSMQVLRAVRALNLPDWAIGAGFVRNPVWDAISGKAKRTPPSDIDVLFHDPADVSLAREAGLEAQLFASMPGLDWSVKNQARMHLRNGDPPYASTEDALRFWLETPTCVAVRLEAGDRLHLIAPHGLDDLLALRVRPTPQGRRHRDAYRDRIASKNWQHFWPSLTIENP
jgi:uncharacterized protein